MKTRHYCLQTAFLERYVNPDYDDDPRLRILAEEILFLRDPEAFESWDEARRRVLATAALEHGAEIADGVITRHAVLCEEILRLRGVIDTLIDGARELVNTADLIAHRPNDDTIGRRG